MHVARGLYLRLVSICLCSIKMDNARQDAADSEDDSDQAKMQRILDFFRELGEQYWGWQVCCAIMTSLSTYSANPCKSAAV